MTNETNPGTVEPCPFCAAKMAHCIDKEGEFWMHPGTVTDGDCFMSGQGIFPRQLMAWNQRAAQSQPAATVQGFTALDNISCAACGCIAYQTHNGVPKCLDCLAALKAEPAAKAGDARSISVAEEWAVYMDEAVSKAPEPLRQLGEYLAGLLDEDQWKTAERYLNAAALSSPASQSVEKIIRALEQQMEAQADDSTPSSLHREKGLVWLEGWFDLSAALSLPHKEEATHPPVGEQGAWPENLAEIIEAELNGWKGANGGIYAIHAAALGVSIKLRALILATTTTERGRG